MIKKLWCLIWGHKIREKAMTGNSIKTTDMMTYTEVAVPLYKWEYHDYCPRCGKK